MLNTLTTALALVAAVNAHAIFHKASVNGVDQGQLFGVRAPDSNTYIGTVDDPNIACNTGLHQPVSKDVIDVKPGDKIGMQWNHVIDGPQGAGDQDDPIASSHKGPVLAYFAKVDDASTSTGSGLKWFKVAEEGLNNGKWGVDSKSASLLTTLLFYLRDVGLLTPEQHLSPTRACGLSAFLILLPVTISCVVKLSPSIPRAKRMEHNSTCPALPSAFLVQEPVLHPTPYPSQVPTRLMTRVS